MTVVQIKNYRINADVVRYCAVYQAIKPAGEPDWVLQIQFLERDSETLLIHAKSEEEANIWQMQLMR